MFTTLGVFAGRPWFLERHLLRLEAEARRFGVRRLESKRLRELVARGIQVNGLRRGVIRIGGVLGRGSRGLFALCEPARATPRTVIVQVVEVVAPRLGGYAKSQHHLRWSSFRRQSVSAGCFDLLVVRSGRLTETSRFHLFLDRGGDYATPPDSEVFPGIARAAWIDNRKLPTTVKSLSISDLMQARGVILANSVRGVVPVTKVKDQDGRVLWKRGTTPDAHLKQAFEVMASGA